MAEELKTQALSPKIVDLARRYHSIKRQADELKETLEGLKAERDQLADALKEIMEQEEMTKFALAGIGTFFLQSQFYPKVVGDPDKAIEWLDGNGAAMIAPRSVDRTRLKEFIRELLDNDKPLPPEELISSSSITYVKMLQAK